MDTDIKPAASDGKVAVSWYYPLQAPGCILRCAIENLLDISGKGKPPVLTQEVKCIKCMKYLLNIILPSCGFVPAF